MKHKKLKIGLLIALALILVIAAIFFIYVGTYYEANWDLINKIEYTGYTQKEIDSGTLAFVPNMAYKSGVVFYPGGKVERDAYIPLMRALSSKGVLCILVDMPFNLAVFDISRADGVRDGFDKVEKWYMAGHSLGGSMACSYVADNIDSFAGVILLAAYSTEDLTQTKLSVLSIYGSEDLVLSRESYEENKKNLPSGFSELVIEGGNHAYFGTYGEQSGDGKAKITNREQIEITANKIAEFVK